MDQARQRARRTVERFFAVSVVLAAISAVLAAPAAKAAPGALDPSFGAAGEVTLRQSPTVDVLNRVRGNLAVGAAGANMVVISSSNSWASILPGHDWAVAVEFGRPSVAHDLVPFSEDGRVVRMVAVGSAGDDFALAAFDGLGSTIRTFGQDGRVTTPFGGRAEARTGVWTGSSYLVFGTADVAGSSQVALARYGAGGALDPSFGNLGTSLLNLTPGRDVATTAAVTPAGILVGGHAGGAAFLARFRLDGSLDPTFGTAGVVLLDLSTGDDAIHGLVVHGTAVLVAGHAGDDAVMARLANGQLDPAFGLGGTIRTRFGGSRASFADLSTQFLDGKVVAAATVTRPGGATDAALLRVDASGSPDLGFGTGGEVVVDLGTVNDRTAGVVVAPNNGNPPPFHVMGTGASDLVLAHRSPNGENLGEPQRFDLGSGFESVALGMAVQGDGRIVVIGRSSNSLLLTRLLAGGALDSTFRPGRRVVSELGVFHATDVISAPDGGILVLGQHGDRLVVARFATSGELDLGFGDRGLATVGTAAQTVGARLLPIPDGSFIASPGIVHVTARGDVTRRSSDPSGPIGYAALDASGGILYAPQWNATNVGMFATRWLLNGQRDTSYASGAGRGRGVPEAIAVLPDGRSIVAGDARSVEYPPPTDHVLAAFRSDGQLDRTFGDQGFRTLDLDVFDHVADVIAQPDGKIVVVGHTSHAGGEYELVVIRYHRNGSLDRSFAHGGTFISSRLLGGQRVRLQPDGRLLVAGTAPGYTATVLRLAPTALAAGTARASGWNNYGQLGEGTQTNRAVATPVAGLGKASSVAGGANHSLAVRADGTVAAWGWNMTSQLGDGTATDRSTPVTVKGLTGVTSVAAGYLHSLALRSDGTVWAWGWNGYGQLGDGTTTLRPTPEPVPGLTGIVAIAAGAYHSYALAADGTMWLWGWNAYGQVDFTLIDRHRPVQLPRKGIQAIAAGAYHGLALTGGGSVWMFGFNAGAQLGQPYRAFGAGDFVQGLPSPVSAIAAGALHNLALLDDGSVWSWGWNGLGQFGDGTTAEGAMPVPVAGLTKVAVIAAGGYHSMALLFDGTARAWGWNALGQLGDGTSVDRHTPVPVLGVTDGRSIAAGIVHTLTS